MRDEGDVGESPPPRPDHEVGVDLRGHRPAALHLPQGGAGHLPVVELEAGHPRDPAWRVGVVPDAAVLDLGPVDDLGEGHLDGVGAGRCVQQLGEGDRAVEGADARAPGDDDLALRGRGDRVRLPGVPGAGQPLIRHGLEITDPAECDRQLRRFVAAVAHRLGEEIHGLLQDLVGRIRRRPRAPPFESSSRSPGSTLDGAGATCSGASPIRSREAFHPEWGRGWGRPSGPRCPAASAPRARKNESPRRGGFKGGGPGD